MWVKDYFVADKCVFFFKQKTAYEMRISDWSSDVCSSDLPRPVRCSLDHRQPGAYHHPHQVHEGQGGAGGIHRGSASGGDRHRPAPHSRRQRIAKERSEERCVGKECVRRVDLGGRRILKKQNTMKILLSSTTTLYRT